MSCRDFEGFQDTSVIKLFSPSDTKPRGSIDLLSSISTTSTPSVPQRSNRQNASSYETLHSLPFCHEMQIQYRHRLFLSDLARGRCLRPEQSSSPNFSMGHHSLNLCTHHASSMSLYYLPAKHTHILPENRCCMLQSVDSRLYFPIESKSQGTNTEKLSKEILFFSSFCGGTCSSRSPLLSSSLQLSILQNVACVDFVHVFIFRSKRINEFFDFTKLTDICPYTFHS